MKAESLLRLYPRAWRERYGEELLALIADRALTPQDIFDLIAGAIDARLTRRDTVPSVLKKACYGRTATFGLADGVRGAVVMIVASLACVGLKSWARHRGLDGVAEFAKSISFTVPFLLMMHVMYLRQQSRTAKIVITGGTLMLLMGISAFAAR